MTKQERELLRAIARVQLLEGLRPSDKFARSPSMKAALEDLERALTEIDYDAETRAANEAKNEQG